VAFGKENDLKGFEQMRAIYLSSEEFSIDNDLLTPTFKLKRETAHKAYKKEIDDMYTAISNGRSFN
jgi:long-chain acyl-CoA synthetase